MSSRNLSTLCLIAVVVSALLWLTFAGAGSPASTGPAAPHSAHMPSVSGMQQVDSQLSDGSLRAVLAPPRSAADKPTPESPQPEGTNGSLEPIHVTVEPLAMRNIKARQSSIASLLRKLQGQEEPSIGWSPGGAARSTLELSVMVIYDATHKSRFYMVAGESIAEVAARQAAEGPPLWKYDESAAHRINGGGANYEIPHGEFPIYDRVQGLRKEFEQAQTLEQLPLEEIFALAREALRYRVE